MEYPMPPSYAEPGGPTVNNIYTENTHNYSRNGTSTAKELPTVSFFFLLETNGWITRRLQLAIQIRGVEIGIVLLVLVVWAGAIALFFNRWGKIRMLLPYQPDYKSEQLKVPGTGVCTGQCNGQHSHQVMSCQSSIFFFFCKRLHGFFMPIYILKGHLLWTYKYPFLLSVLLHIIYLKML